MPAYHRGEAGLPTIAIPMGNRAEIALCSLFIPLGRKGTEMAQAVRSAPNEKKQRAPEWVYLFSDEQFVQWCKNHKLYVCSQVREFTEDERTAIFRYAERRQLVN